MLGFTYIGEIYFVVGFVLFWSIYAIRTKKYHLIQHLYLNLFFTVILTHVFKMATQIPRPIIGEAITSSFSFPSGHTAIVASMAATIQWATVNTKIQPSKLLHYFLFIIVGMTALSRVYLGMHWVTDVFGGVLLVHPIVTSCNYLIKNKEIISYKKLTLILSATLVTAYLLINLFPSHKHYLMKYQINNPMIEINYENWQLNQLTTLRFNRTHLSAEPLNVQFLGSRDMLNKIMIDNDWHQAPSFNLSSAIGLLNSPKYNYISPLLKQLYLKKEPVASFYKSTDQTLYVAKFWESEYVTSHGTILLGTVSEIHDPNAPSPWLEPKQKSFTIYPLLSLTLDNFKVIPMKNNLKFPIKWDKNIFKIEVLDE
jgi:undecaprenyl-diphosphatase